MAKIFDFAKAYPDSQAIAVPDVTWFRKNQKFLLWMANWSQEGQKLLKMEQTTLERIDEIWPNRVSQYNLDGSITTDFRVGCKWTNLINFQWEWVQEMAKKFQQVEAGRLMANEWSVPVFGFQPALGATGTYYPDAGTGGTTCDGSVGRTGRNESWATIISSAGDTVAYTTYQYFINAFIDCSTTSNQYNAYYKGFASFDTSTIGAASTIDSAYIRFLGGSSNSRSYIPGYVIVESTQSAANNLANGDFLQTGSTGFAYMDSANYPFSAEISLNASGLSAIKKTSQTKLAVVQGSSVSSIQSGPTWQNNIDMIMALYGSDASGTSNDPYLKVNYTPASFIPRTTIIA